MKSKALAALLVTGLIAGALAATPGVASAGKAEAQKKKKKKKAGPLVVGTDPAGDWGSNQDAALAPLGDPLGQDLTEATITMGEGTVDFIIKLNSLPPTGGVPEFSRYTWNFSVKGEPRELDGKFTNFSRGACDPTAATCPPPRNPGLHPFSLRGNCGVTPIGTIDFTTCEELALIEATFDAAAGTITIPVPLDVLGAKPGTKIAPAVGIFGGTLSAAPAAWGTFDSFPMDTMMATKTFVIPKK